MNGVLDIVWHSVQVPPGLRCRREAPRLTGALRSNGTGRERSFRPGVQPNTTAEASASKHQSSQRPMRAVDEHFMVWICFSLKPGVNGRIIPPVCCDRMRRAKMKKCTIQGRPKVEPPPQLYIVLRVMGL